MGIQDRDYMKRRPNDGPSHDRSAEGKLDQLASNLLGKQRRLLIGIVVAIVTLILIGLIIGMF